MTYHHNINNLENTINPQPSAIWGWLNFTNHIINRTRYYHNNLVSFEGRLFYLPTNLSYQGYRIELIVDGNLYPQNFNITDENGKFRIDFVIPYSSNVFHYHKIEAEVNNPEGNVINLNYFIIYSKSASIFENIIFDPSIPLLTEEHLVIDGFLKYENGTVISNGKINYTYYNGANIISKGSYLTDPSGSLNNPLDPIQVPNSLLSQIDLKINYSNLPFVDYSEIIIPNIRVFSDVNWSGLNFDLSTSEGALYTITGKLSSITDSSLKINDRELVVLYNGVPIDTVQTRADGTFTSTFRIPDGNGTFPIQIQLVNDAGKDISYGPIFIFVDVGITPSGGTGELPPFLIFSLIFFPILAFIIVGLIVYALRYYKKQEEESRVVNVPLISRIKNLKILKDTGRLEESLSYLFNAIYMDLVNAKYGRARKDNETIRDFAIVSVKELKLTPATVYPFIQKIEEVIYAKPFKITEKDFYKTCELFSPIYFQLTGYNFVLNF